MNLPAYLESRDGYPLPTGSPSRVNRIVRKGLSGISRAIADSIERDTIASAPGLLQSVDPRFKVLGLLGFVVVSTLVQAWLSLAICYALCVVLAQASNVPGSRMGRIWLAIPLFSLAIMLPATLSLVTPGPPVLVLWHGVAVTAPGVVLAARMAVRTACCVSFASLLALTTRADRLFRGLRALGMPAIFVAVLAMMDRYIWVLARVSEEIHLARISRTVGKTGIRSEHEWVASGMGALFRRTHALGQDVHLAMMSRGYRGEPSTLDRPLATALDAAFLAGAVLCAIIALGIG